MTGIKNIAIIGSGNIADFLATQLFSSQFIIKQVISRNVETGKVLASKVNAEFSTKFEAKKDIDLILICIPDNQIGIYADGLTDNDALVCHCAGSIGMEVLMRFKNHGILYPLQSISKKMGISDFEAPFLIESNSEDGLNLLKGLLETLKYPYRQVDSNGRLHYHLAAVFANNFTNAMIMATEEITEKSHLDFSLLKPLIVHTFEKLKEASAIETQTGPAKREDLITINKHLDLLKDEPELAEIYRHVSLYISEKFKH